MVVAGLTNDGLVINEGGIASFEVSLSTDPQGEVAFSMQIASGDSDVTLVTADTLTFDSTNWNIPQTVTLAAAIDVDSINGTALLNLFAADGTWPMVSVTAVEQDSDSVGLVVNSSTLITTEAGGTATFTIALASRPSAPVVVPIRSGNLAEVGVSVSSLTFTPSNWNQPQTVTLTGVDDLLGDGDQTVSINIGPTSGSALEYRDLTATPLTVTNTDNDVATIIVTAANNLVTSESGDSAYFDVVLTSRPLHPVTLARSCGRRDWRSRNI